MPVNFPNTVQCVCDGPDAKGNQLIFFGSDDGYVRQLDAGTSFDGQVINSSFLLVIDPINSPRLLKRYRKASFEIIGTSYASLTVGYALGWGVSSIGQPGNETEVVPYGGLGQWDFSYWDNFYWDGTTLSPTEAEVVGTAENIAFQVQNATNYTQPFTVNSLFIHFSTRRGLR
jgi:hypothetical protein